MRNYLEWGWWFLVNLCIFLIEKVVWRCWSVQIIYSEHFGDSIDTLIGTARHLEAWGEQNPQSTSQTDSIPKHLNLIRVPNRGRMLKKCHLYKYTAIFDCPNVTKNRGGILSKYSAKSLVFFRHILCLPQRYVFDPLAVSKKTTDSPLCLGSIPSLPQ